MTGFEVVAWLIVLAALFTYSAHALPLPRAVGLLLGGLFAAIALVTYSHFFPGGAVAGAARGVLARLNFPGLLLNGILGFIIFAGALEVDVEELRNRRLTVLVLASAGVLISTAIVGAGLFWILRLLGTPVPLAGCLLFGALISPTDPIAVLAIMRELSVSRRLQVEMAGESLFNDGIGIVLFSVLASAATQPAGSSGAMLLRGVELFFREAVGGCIAGLLIGGAAYLLLKRIDDPHVEVLMSFALVSAIVLTSKSIGVSAPLGCAVAGLFIARHEHQAMKKATRDALETLWSFTDFVLNAILFFLLGLQAIWVGLPGWRSAGALILAIVLVLAARLLSVAAAAKIVPGQNVPLRSVVALTWGGLHGGLSIALALSMPALPQRDLLLRAAYAIVLFSLIVQGSTVAPVLRRLGFEGQQEISAT